MTVPTLLAVSILLHSPGCSERAAPEATTPATTVFRVPPRAQPSSAADTPALLMRAPVLFHVIMRGQLPSGEYGYHVALSDDPIRSHECKISNYTLLALPAPLVETNTKNFSIGGNKLGEAFRCTRGICKKLVGSVSIDSFDEAVESKGRYTLKGTGETTNEFVATWYSCSNQLLPERLE